MSRIDREITVVLRGDTKSLNVSLQNAAGRIARFAASVNEANSTMMQSAARSNQAMQAVMERVQTSQRAYGPMRSELTKTARGFSYTAAEAAKFGSRAQFLYGNIKNVRGEMSRWHRPTSNFTSTLQAAGRSAMDLGAHLRTVQHPAGRFAGMMQEAGHGLKTLGTNAAVFGTRIGTFTRTLSEGGRGLSQVDSAARRAGGSFVSLSGAMQSAGASSAQMTLSSMRLRGSMGDVSQYARSSALGFGALAQASTKISGAFRNADGQAQGFTRTISNFSGSFTKSMQQAGEAAKDFQGRIVDFIGFTMLGERVKRMGQTILGVFASSVASFAAFEDSFALVEKTTQATEVQYARLAEEIREVARVAPLAVTELNQVAGVAGQLGVGIDHIAQFTENMAKMGVATNVTAEEAAIFQARIGAIMQLDYGDDMERMSSAVVDLGNNFAAREDEIFRFTERIAASGQVVGLTTADLAAFSTAFTAVGVRAERGGTAFQRVIFRMMDAVQEGGEHLHMLADTAGVTANEFARLFDEEPAEAVLRFIEGLDRIGSDANSVMTELFGNNVRTTQSFLALAGAGDLARSAVERGNTAWDQNIALNEEAATRFDTLANRLRVLRNRVNDVAIGMGQTLAPVVETVATGMVAVIEVFTRMPEPLQNFVIAAGIVAGMLLVVAGNMSLLYYPAMVLKNTIIPGLTRGYVESSKALARLTHANITAAASYHAHAAGATRLKQAQIMTVAWSQRIGATLSAMMTTLARAAAATAVLLGKYLVLAAAIWGIIQVGKAAKSSLSGVHDSFVDASDAAEQLATSVGISLNAMQGMARMPGISNEFVQNNKDTIEDLRDLSTEMRGISATQIMLELVLRGADPQEALDIMRQLETAVGRDLGVEFDVFITDGALDAPVVIAELTEQLSFMGDEFKNLPFIQKDLRDSIAQTSASLAQLSVAAGEPDGLIAWTDAMIEFSHSMMPVGKDGERFGGMTRDMQAMIEGLGVGLGATTEEMQIFSDTLEQAFRADPDMARALIEALRAMRTAMLDGKSDLDGASQDVVENVENIDAAIRNLGGVQPMEGMARDIGRAQANAAGLGDEIDSLGDKSTEAEEKLRSMAESASDAVSNTASIVSDVLGQELDNVRGAAQDLAEVFGSIDESTSLSEAFQNAQTDVQDFIDFTRWAQDEGIDDWIIGLVQGGGPEAMAQARSEGAQRLTELSEGLVQDFLTSRALEIDAEEAFARHMLDSDRIVSVVSRSMEVAGNELKARNTLRSMGIDEIGMAFLEEAFSDIPGGMATVMAAFESGEGLGALQELLPDLIRQAKANADLEFDKWPGNFQGKGAAAAAAALSELGLIGEDLPPEIEVAIAARTEGEGEVVTLTELIEEFGKSASEEEQKELSVAIETGDLETAIDLLAEFAKGGDDGKKFTVEVDVNTVTAYQRMQEIEDSTFEAIVDAVGGDDADARALIASMTDEEWEAFVSVESNASEVGEDLDGVAYKERIARIVAQVQGVERVRGILNSLSRTISVNVHARWAGMFGAASGGILGRANGGIVNTFANGGEAHYPQIAPGGTWRVWAEPETNGEAYIPFAKGKRGRAMRVWEQVGRRFGVEGFSSGGYLEEGSLTTGIRSIAPDKRSSMYTGGPANAMHKPFWVAPYERADSLEEMKRLLEQQERQLTLMERQERRRELEKNIREARKEHGADSSEAKDAQKALNEWEEQVRREDVRLMIDMIMEEQRAIEAHNRMIAENRQRFHDERRPRELHLEVLNERIKAEERFTDRWMQLVAERDQIIEGMRSNLESMLREEKRIKDQLVELERQYNKDVKRLRDQREESIQQALQQRRDALSQFFDPMTRRESEWGNTIGAVTDNIMAQVTTFQDWMKNLQLLRDRGLSEEAIDVLGFNDPSSAHDVEMFVNATDKELQELNSVVMKQMRAVNRQTSREQQNMYGELGDNLKDIQEQFQKDLNDLNKRFRDDQRSLRDELAQIGKDSAKSYADAIAEGLESSIPAIREAARRVQEAMRGSEESGVHPRPPDGSTETAPTGYLVENLLGRDYVDRYFVRIGNRWYAAAGPGQQREALRLYGPPHRRFEGKPQSYDRLVDYFGPGVMDKMKPNRPESYRHTTYDVGGKLPPGLTMAYNGTGQAEYVLRPKHFVSEGASSAPVHVHVDTYVDGEKVSESVTKHQIRHDRRIRVRAGK